MILWRNIGIFSLFIILIPTPDFSHFYYMLDGNLGSLLYGDVSVMVAENAGTTKVLVTDEIINYIALLMQGDSTDKLPVLEHLCFYTYQGYPWQLFVRHFHVDLLRERLRTQSFHKRPVFLP